MPKLNITCANAVYHRLSNCLLHLNHDCHATVEKRVAMSSRQLLR